MSLHLKPTMSKSHTTNKRTTKPPRFSYRGTAVLICWRPWQFNLVSGAAPLRWTGLYGGEVSRSTAYLHFCFNFLEILDFLTLQPRPRRDHAPNLSVRLNHIGWFRADSPAKPVGFDEVTATPAKTARPLDRVAVSAQIPAWSGAEPRAAQLSTCQRNPGRPDGGNHRPVLGPLPV